MGVVTPCGSFRSSKMTSQTTPQVPTIAGVLAGKRGLIMGLANQRSIAWGIAKAAREAGAELAFT